MPGGRGPMSEIGRLLLTLVLHIGLLRLRSDSGAGTNGPGCQIELNVWGSTPNAVWSKKK